MTTATPAPGKRSGRRATRARWARTWAFLGGVIEGAARLERRGDLTADESRAVREHMAALAMAAIRRLAQQHDDSQEHE
jgi:hypothetical protein